MILSIGLYAAIVLLTLAALIVLGYKPRTEINTVFDKYRRTPALRRTVTAWFFVMIVVFLFVQALRLPFLKYVLRRLP
ncbi:MAG: hypothetical protein IPG71_04425 [bacterium]|nr:hypothetical protein [bacterium]